MRTELEDISEVEYRQLRLERVVLVSVWTSGTQEDADNAMAELKLLAETAGSEVLEALVQRRNQPDPATYIGRGKVEEVADVVRITGADTVVCDGELQPAQLRNLEDLIKVKVVDRTALILDIFASHAKSAEGKAQVELAQLQYLKQRLRGWGGNLSRQMDVTREGKRAERRRNRVPSVAIVGYTNAGKSSLLNRLTGAGVLVEDALFATLDPTTRRTETRDGRVFTLTDTVGFVRHLPHDLVEAFRSTLEESTTADLLLHVVDASDPDPEGQIAAVRQVLAEIGASDVPELLVCNKADRADETTLLALRAGHPGCVVVSARTGHGLEELADAVEARLPSPEVWVETLIPYSRGDLMDRIHRTGTIETLEHTGEGTRVRARVHPGLAEELGEYGV